MGPVGFFDLICSLLSLWLINIYICQLMGIYHVLCSILNLIGGSKNEQFLTSWFPEKLEYSGDI